jgi:hypothetical protein
MFLKVGTLKRIPAQTIKDPRKCELQSRNLLCCPLLFLPVPVEYDIDHSGSDCS